VREHPEINATAPRRERELEVLVWNYGDDDVPARPADVELSARGLPTNVSNALLEHFRVDSAHSNAYSAWQEMGSPQAPSAEQRERLEAAGQLQLVTSPAWIAIHNGTARVPFRLPRQGVSLLRISW